MFKRIFTVSLAALLVQVICLQPSFARSKEQKETERVEKIRAGILRLGAGPDAHVAIKLRDKTKLTGYIAEAKADSFVMVDAKSGVPTNVVYGDVQQAKGSNLSTGAKIAIGIGIGVGLTILVAYLIFINTTD